ncbi:Eukaryotic translation initiation factor 3 subunit L [Dissostichus eleginoides]|uniref:Eukaryotic translation initiation factor 3 subunit L n=1 Tax=Dissostichus eleginoides TaxID=100907 RepID=A0AAD9CCX1_DISEL|nr:Eukaryotic translation initiation factor 3 subunit L [Dissostichus eleginoides]
MSPTVSEEYRADTQRKRKRKSQADDSSEPECELSGRSRFRTSVFIRVIDRLVSELDRRYQSYNDVCENFGFLNRFHSISPQDLRSAARSLQQKYSSDLEEEFVEEAVHFRELPPSNKDWSIVTPKPSVNLPGAPSIFMELLKDMGLCKHGSL